MKSPKTEESSIGDLFALPPKEQLVSNRKDANAIKEGTSNNVNLVQVGIIVGATAFLLWIFYLAITKFFIRHADNIMPAPKRPVEVKPINPEEKPQSETASESPVVEHIISAPEKKSSQLL